MAHVFATMLNDWHSQPDKEDAELDSEIHNWYVDPPVTHKLDPFFSPSSANADLRMLYEKIIANTEDTSGQPPHQGRWTRIGTAIGDIIQRDILFIEKHVKDAPFRFERTATGEPMFEEFAKTNVPIKYRGHSFYLSGSPDGIMTYTTEDGELIRVGLEIKSKQTTYAKTGDFGMKGPEESHVEQCKVYSMMYGLDYYIILYVNASHKTWNMTDADIAKYPDIRAFGNYFTQEDKLGVLDKFASVMEAVRTRKPMNTDLSKWTFNNYKYTIAKGLSDEHLAELAKEVESTRNSKLTEYKKRSIIEAYEEILKLRAS